MFVGQDRAPVEIPEPVCQVGVGQLVAYQASGDDVVAQGALEVAHRALDQQCRALGLLQIAGVDPAGRLLFERGDVTAGGQRQAEHAGQRRAHAD